MGRARFTEGQIAEILESGKVGRSISTLCREHGISKQTYYRWKASREPEQKDRLQRLEDENQQLKQLVAEQALQLHRLNRLLTNRENRHRSTGKGDVPQQVQSFRREGASKLKGIR